MAAALTTGKTIGDSNCPPFYWSSKPLGSTITWCTDQGCSGQFTDTVSYLGVRFKAGSQTHFGWILMQVPGGVGAANILGYAYETRPGVPILAGAKPVPVLLRPPRVERPGFLRLMWNSEPNMAYQVQAMADLAVFWTNLPFVIPASSTNTMVDLPIIGQKQFFRVVKGD